MLPSPFNLLIQAAEYVESQSKLDNSEHGYAAPPFTVGTDSLKPKMKSSRKSHDRTTHNEIEKNRRAHLRSCLDNLKAIVPLREDSTRHTTLGLLNQACVLIKCGYGYENADEKAQHIFMEKQNVKKLTKRTKNEYGVNSPLANLERENQSLSQTKSQEGQRNVLLKRTLLQLTASRKRTNSTGSAWSSSFSESSTDSDKDDEIIDVTDCSDEPSALKAALRRLPSNLITINVPKALALPSRPSKMTKTLA